MDNEVGGFVFAKEETINIAKTELDGITYIKAKIDYGNPAKVLEVYRSLNQRKLFHTVVGYSFMYDLREFLVESPEVDIQDIPPILVSIMDEHTEKSEKDMVVDGKKQDKSNKSKAKKAFIMVGNRTTFTISVMLALTVIVMLWITVSSSSPTILNYEDRIVDKYEQWNQELTEREQALDKLEQQHN